MKRTEAISLCNTTANRYERCVKIEVNYRSLEISVLRDMVVVKYGLDQVVMDFAESILEIK